MQDTEVGESLEFQKLKLEIEALKHQWWKKPSYIGAMAPIIIAVLAFLGAWMSGYFDGEREKLELQMEELNQQHTTLKERISAIDAANTRLEAAAGSLVEARSIRGNSKNPQQELVFREFNESFDALIEMIRTSP